MKRSALLALAALAILYVYNIARNVHAQRYNDTRCAALADETHERITKAGPWLAQLFADDAEWVRAALSDSLVEMCGAVHRRLAWWRWNFGAEMTLAPNAERETRLRAAVARARARCPAVAATLFTGLPGAADMGPKFCALIDTLDPARPATTVSPGSHFPLAPAGDGLNLASQVGTVLTLLVRWGRS